jgi:HD-GYP domain-containing protein (c-di-GMP phosphodiesterase class II)
MEIVRTSQLKIGMFVVEPDCSWTELPFALQGFVISTPGQVDIFQTKCRFVYIDRSRSQGEHYAPVKHGKDRALKSASLGNFKVDEVPGARLAGQLHIDPETEKRRGRRRRFLDFLHNQKDSESALALSRELAYIEPRFDDLQNALLRTFQDISAEKDIDIGSLREGVRDMSGSLQRNADALMWLLRLKRLDQYSFDHAMDVAVYLLLLGTHLGWRGQRLLDLGLAGILQDIGKTQLSVEILTKKTALSEAEKAQVQSHVASSLEILYGHAHMSNDILVTISRHHERWDGSGYPRRLQFEQIGLAAEMAGVVDSFCAMLKNKPYRSALGHQEALEELHGLRGKKFNPALMEQFVQCVGLYPIGTLVELSTGEVAVVIQQNRVQRARPRLLMMLDKAKEPIRGYRVLDLREELHRDCRVTKALPHDAYGLAENDYYLG